MTEYRAPTRDMQFLLFDVLDIERFSNLPGFSETSPDLVNAILEEGAKFCEGVLQPLNQSADKEGCVLNADKSVTTPTGFKEAYAQFVEGGWPGLSVSQDYGGQGLPIILAMVINEFVSSANMAFGMYPGLAHGAYSALMHHGSEEQKQTYLPKLASGEWGGTMNLTEPHCGTDLGLLRTKAVPQADGSYKISGQKIFISAGEHDLTDNIIHLVLARIEGAPEGVKGISLFVAPKFLVNEDGSVGERNALSCGALEEKMGIHGNSTCVMNYDEATAWLVGEEHKGLRAMFTMMNEARLGVGLQGLSQSEVAYQNAAIYAKDRIQGRALTGDKNPDGPADPIIVHPDVRRMLMDQRAFNEAARALVMWTGLHADLELASPDENIRQKGGDYMSLLTPIIKSYLTEKGYWHATNAQQVLGGHGYVREWGMEQFVRDARIAMIYEGANGVQALDLVGRKLMMDGGRSWTTYFAEIDELVEENSGDEALQPYLDGLKDVKAKLKSATDWLAENALKNFDHAGAASSDYLALFALTCFAHMWALMAKSALAKMASGDDDPYYATKLTVGQYFLDRVLPEAEAHAVKIRAGADTTMALPAEAF